MLNPAIPATAWAGLPTVLVFDRTVGMEEQLAQPLGFFFVGEISALRLHELHQLVGQWVCRPRLPVRKRILLEQSKDLLATM